MGCGNTFAMLIPGLSCPVCLSTHYKCTIIITLLYENGSLSNINTISSHHSLSKKKEEKCPALND
jgi:hypothetical protein